MEAPTLLGKRPHSPVILPPSPKGPRLEEMNPNSEISKVNPEISKLMKNASKALEEHFLLTDDPFLYDVYGTLPSLDGPVSPLRFLPSTIELQGKRTSMQDASFIIENADRVLLGIFDGHGQDSRVAEIARDHFQKKFDDMLSLNTGSVKKTVRDIALQIDQEIDFDEELDLQGSTALVCYIDKKVNVIYTATLGDSEAYIYRKIEEVWLAIPLSTVRNWDTAKDMDRIEQACPGTVAQWEERGEIGKDRRFPIGIGCNVSRAFGDNCINVMRENEEASPPISTKFKITAHKVLPGDVIVAACDGVWDFIKEQREVIEDVKVPELLGQSNLASRIAFKALMTGESTDNISVIALKVI